MVSKRKQRWFVYLGLAVTIAAFAVGSSLFVRKIESVKRIELLSTARSLRGALYHRRDRLARLVGEAVARFEWSAADDASSGSANSSAAESVVQAMTAAGAAPAGWVLSDTDGAVLGKSGDTLGGLLGTPSDIIFDIAVEGQPIADLSVSGGGPAVRAYAPIDAASARGPLVLAILIPLDLEEIASTVAGAGRHIALVRDGVRILASGPYRAIDFSRLPTFFDLIETSKTGQFRSIGGEGIDVYSAVVPIFDFEQWEILGHLVVGQEKTEVLADVRGAQVAIGILGLLASAVTVAGMIYAVRTVGSRSAVAMQDRRVKRAVRGTLSLIVVLVLLPIAVGIGFALVRSNQVTSRTMSRPVEAAAEVARLYVAHPVTDEWDAEFLSTMKTAVGADITIIPPEGNRVSTLREDRIDFDASNAVEWHVEDGVEYGAIKISYVVHRYARLELPNSGSVLMMTMEDTAYRNSIAGSNTKLLLTLLVAALLIWAFVWIIATLERERFFKLSVAGYLFITPALVILLWWAVGPLLFSFFLTFHRWSIVNPAKPFVGFANYVRMFNDHLFWQAMANTAYYTLHIPLAIAVSLAVAMAMNRDIKGITVFRTVFYLPTVNSLVVTSLMWRLIFNPEFGLLNYLLGIFGIPGLSWLSHPTTAMPSIMLISVWFSIGGQMILFLAGLKSIPKTYYEVADIDGAPSVHKFWYITLPLLRPTLLFVLITSTIGSFQVFTQVYMLTQGGPAGSTDVAMYRIFTEAWYNLRMGYGATQAWTLCLVIFVFTVLQFRLFSREIKYS